MLGGPSNVLSPRVLSARRIRRVRFETKRAPRNFPLLSTMTGVLRSPDGEALDRILVFGSVPCSP